MLEAESLWALVLTFTYSLIAWVLLPAWPLGRDYTRGLLGLDQGEMAVTGYQRLAGQRADWLAPFANGDFAALSGDDALMARAMPAATRLFADNCAACHGDDATGGPGFPDLTDAAWLWEGDPETIAETLRVGINSPHPDTRFGQMPAFDWISRVERHDLAAYVAALPSGAADHDGSAAMLFDENCAACHGERGAGGLGIGAPVLSDDHWIYGGDTKTIFTTLSRGRQGVMPSWQDRLSAAEINLLALYVARLGEADAGAGQ
ncbi:MAG: cytochrome-c oxidase, cbb3-type subunit III [Alphaproteobacteria bacterium HGW-Alphaproteobacteria-6]|nr:MAG: cytochrome-c oxidase, cbb3-type subunit III [Alphaproteobacteria bacterium HGW-Alphaproteobacteria-6]